MRNLLISVGTELSLHKSKNSDWLNYIDKVYQIGIQNKIAWSASKHIEIFSFETWNTYSGVLENWHLITKTIGVGKWKIDLPITKALIPWSNAIAAAKRRCVIRSWSASFLPWTDDQTKLLRLLELSRKALSCKSFICTRSSFNFENKKVTARVGWEFFFQR